MKNCVANDKNKDFSNETKLRTRDKSEDKFFRLPNKLRMF